MLKFEIKDSDISHVHLRETRLKGKLYLPRDFVRIKTDLSRLPIVNVTGNNKFYF